MSSSSYWGHAWQFTLIHVLIILVVGATLFWIVRKVFERNSWLAILFTISIVLVCIAAILLQLLP
jgi:hypothetical protein